MEYPYFRGLEADRYSFYRVPKALVKADLFQKMSGDAKLLYAVLLDRMSLSIKNGWQDKHGNAYIICTIEEVMDSIHCARQKAVKLLDELEQARNRTLILNVGKIPPFNPNHFCQCFSCQTLCLSCGFDICAEGFKTGTIFNFRHITSPSYIV